MAATMKKMGDGAPKTHRCFDGHRLDVGNAAHTIGTKDMSLRS